MATTLEDTGERMIPEHHKGRNIYGAHFGRYRAGMSLLKDKVVLDIACGSGYGTHLMATVAKKVYGVDVDAGTIAYAAEHYGGKNIVYRQGDGIAIPLEDNSVDVVVSYETIEHIDDYQTFLKEVKRILRSEGLLLLSTPNDVEYAEGNHFHLHEFTYNQLKKLVGQYFKHHKDYFQTLWLSSTILPEALQTSEWETPILTTSTIALRPEQSIYFFMLCSDREISEQIEAQGVIGEHFRQRDLQARNEKQTALHHALEDAKTKTRTLEAKTTKLQKELDTIYTSRAWKTARLLQRGMYSLKYPLNYAKKQSRSTRKP
jgi:ubiquinone/menaquinone biosynthesis C-methylase UbiE